MAAMAEPGREPPRDEPEFPEALTASGRRPGLAHLIWVVPLAAVLIGGWLALRAFFDRGPEVEISFKSAEGLETGKTRVKYKDVDVGGVRSIVLAEDRKTVIVKVELTPQARGLIVEDTRFWVVRPRITGGQALGLATILSGSYIALDPGKSAESRRAFVGLEVPPVVTTGDPGRVFVLRAEDIGSIDLGSPVYFRRVRVGQTVSAELDPDGKGVTFRIFVNAPHDRYVSRATRFWNASGVDVSVDASGLHLETQSLMSILVGGIAFEDLPRAEPGPPAAAEAVFTLFKNRDTALNQAPLVRDVYVLHFSQSVRGLSVGAPVDFRGVNIGEVTRISLDYLREQSLLRTAVEINIYPERAFARLRTREPNPDPARRLATLKRFVDRGLRAQLRTANLVSGQMYVTLDFFPKEKPVKMDMARVPLELPTVPGGFEELQNSVENVVKKLEKIPFDEIVADVRRAAAGFETTLATVNALAARADSEIAPELKATLEQARTTLEQAQTLLSEDAPLQSDLSRTLRDVTRAAGAIRSLADYLERHPESLLRGKREEPAQ